MNLFRKLRKIFDGIKLIHQKYNLQFTSLLINENLKEIKNTFNI